MNNTIQQNDEARHEMDDVLHDYFKAELPHSWPAFQEPRQVRTKAAPSLWSRYAGRLALAASIASLMAGYLMLGDHFPRTQQASGVQDLNQDMSLRERDKKKNTATPAPQRNQPEELPMPKVID